MTLINRPASEDRGRRLATGLLMLLALAGALTAIDFLLFDRFDYSLLFWDWYRPRPRLPAMAFMVAIAGAIALFALRWKGDVRGGGWLPIAGVIAAMALTGLIGKYYLLDFPNSGDEYAYYFQALTFEAGRLWNPAPSQGSVVAASFTWVAQGRWVGQYPPVWPAMIALADQIGIPVWALNGLLMIPAAALVFSLVRRDATRGAAGLAVAVIVLAPFTLFQAASYFSHFFAALLVLIAAWAYRRGTVEDRWPLAVLCGAVIGLLANTRTSDVLVVAIPIGIALLINRRWKQLVAMGFAGAPFIAAILVYQHAITGDMFKPVYYFGGRTLDHLYFDVTSIKEGAKSTVGKLSELSLWVCPILVPIWLYASYLKIRDRSYTAVDALFPMALLLFVFYPLDPGNRYGPRYYFEFWPITVVTIATAARLFPPMVGRYLGPAAIGTILYGLILTPFLGAQFRTIVLQRTDPYRQVAKAHLHHGVVCIDYNFGKLPIGGTDYARNGIDANKPLLFVNCTHRTAAQIRRIFLGYPLYYYYHPRTRNYGQLLKLSN